MRVVLGVFVIALGLVGCRTAKEIAAKDDATCRGYGAQPGTDVYVQCRVAQDQRRDLDDISRRRNDNSGVAAGVALMTGQPIYRR